MSLEKGKDYFVEYDDQGKLISFEYAEEKALKKILDELSATVRFVGRDNKERLMPKNQVIIRIENMLDKLKGRVGLTPIDLAEVPDRIAELLEKLEKKKIFPK